MKEYRWPQGVLAWGCQSGAATEMSKVVSLMFKLVVDRVDQGWRLASLVRTGQRQGGVCL
jgi:hypothetical protein